MLRAQFALTARRAERRPARHDEQKLFLTNIPVIDRPAARLELVQGRTVQRALDDLSGRPLDQVQKLTSSSRLPRDERRHPRLDATHD